MLDPNPRTLPNPREAGIAWAFQLISSTNSEAAASQFVLDISWKAQFHRIFCGGRNPQASSKSNSRPHKGQPQDSHHVPEIIVQTLLELCIWNKKLHPPIAEISSSRHPLAVESWEAETFHRVPRCKPIKKKKKTLSGIFVLLKEF